MISALVTRWLIIAGIAAAVFGFGFVKGLQHSEREFMQVQLKAWEQSYKQYWDWTARVSVINQRTLQREAELVEGLKVAQQHRQVLENEIRERPTIVRDRPVPVAGECPVCDVVDWGRFICLSNFAKRTGPACSSTDPGHADRLNEPVRPPGADPGTPR